MNFHETKFSAERFGGFKSERIIFQLKKPKILLSGDVR